MNRKELISELNEIANEMDDLFGDLVMAADRAKRLYRKLENLPAEPDEIEDDKKEEGEG